MKDQSSFTLIELLIVIGILAILVAAVVVVLNPAQLLAQARDSKRQQDLSALSSALNTVAALDQTLSFGSSSVVYTSLPDSSSTCDSWGLPALPTSWSYHCVPTTTLQNADGSGWLPVNFRTTGVVSLPSLPVDPQNTSSTGLYYTYVTGGSFQLAARYESTKYQTTEGSDAMYTIGSNLSLAPFLSGLVGWWQFEGNFLDSSGYNNNGTASGTITFVSGQKGGQGAYFNGSSYVDVPYNSSFGMLYAVTLLGWYNTTSTIVGSIVGIKAAHNFLYDWGGNWWSTTQKDTSFSGIPAANNGSWHLVALAYSASDGYARVYLDGVQQVSAYFGGTINASTGDTIIGARSGGLNVFMYGALDNVQVYNRALSASEVQAFYNATK